MSVVSTLALALMLGLGAIYIVHHFRRLNRPEVLNDSPVIVFADALWTMAKGVIVFGVFVFIHTLATSTSGIDPFVEMLVPFVIIGAFVLRAIDFAMGRPPTSLWA